MKDIEKTKYVHGQTHQEEFNLFLRPDFSQFFDPTNKSSAHTHNPLSRSLHSGEEITKLMISSRAAVVRRWCSSIRARNFSTSVKICLDWTPNTNHSGIYSAKAKGFFEEEGLDVEIEQPGPNDQLTPGRKVARGMATFGISSSESAVSFATSDSKVQLVAVAALLQGSTSSICVLESSGITSPKQLDGKRYASYDGRFEDNIVRQMVINDHGKGDVHFHSLDFHGYGESKTMTHGSVVASYLQEGRSDSTWIFTHWEAVMAKRQLEDYKIPYGYSPVILAGTDTLASSPEIVRKFLKALDKGHEFVVENPKEAVQALMAEANHPSLSDQEFLEDSQKVLGDMYLAGGKWGRMEHQRWEKWVDFLCEKKIVLDRDGNVIPRSSIEVAKLFSTEYLP
ncbi:hypothetical protein AAMO2058_001684900 [Amorphochlora amoebiformis]